MRRRDSIGSWWIASSCSRRLMPEKWGDSEKAWPWKTAPSGIKNMVAGAGSTRAIVVDLGEGDRWWSTRLFLLSSLLQALTGVRQLVFRDARARFCGMASPGAVLDRFAAAFPLSAAFLAELRKGEASLDIERETDRQLDLWARIHEVPNGPGEYLAKVGRTSRAARTAAGRTPYCAVHPCRCARTDDGAGPADCRISFARCADRPLIGRRARTCP